MPLTLNDKQLWDRIKKLEGNEFCLVETRQPFKILDVANEGITTKNLEKHNTYWLPRKNVTIAYEHVKQYGKYTSADYEAPSYDPKRMRIPRLAQIIALLAFAVPEEIEVFTRDEGERLFGERRRGIRERKSRPQSL
jgi:hypothetical protein